MIHVTKAPKPKGFDEKVRKPGLRAIAEMVGKPPPYKRTSGKAFSKIAVRERDIPADQFPPYWTEVLDDLMAAYHRICAYSCFRIHPVTGVPSVDHFAAKSRDWRKVYLWSNYRLCSSKLNARKGDARTVLDPFEVQPGWFQLELSFFQVVPNKNLPPKVKRRIQETIDRLGLNDFWSERQKDAARYRSRNISLQTLKEESPFVAEELRRQGRLNPGDVW